MKRLAGGLDFLIGYMIVDEERDAFRGAALVTDTRGIPKDFRYTEPIRPSRLERVLYGGALEAYLREEVILASILGVMEARPTLWVCRVREMLRPLRVRSGNASVVLQESAHVPLDHVGEVVRQGEEPVFLLQASPLNDPLRVEVPREDLGKESQIFTQLQNAAETMDLLEPFGRIAKALQVVAEEGS